jgi:hypothetical protein
MQCRIDGIKEWAFPIGSTNAKNTLEEWFIFRYEVEVKMCNMRLLKERNTNMVCCGRGRLHGVNSLTVIGHSKTIFRINGSNTKATIMSLPPRKTRPFWIRYRVGPSKINLNLTRSISTNGASKEVVRAAKNAEHLTPNRELLTYVATPV